MVWNEPNDIMPRMNGMHAPDDSDSPIEPGLIRVFRLFLSLRLFSLILFFLPSWLNDPTTLREPYRWLAVAGTIFLLVYLSIPLWRARLGKAFLRIAFGIALVGPLVEYGLYNFSRITHSVSDVRQPIFALTIVLILLVWQYRLQTALFVLGGVTLTSLAQFAYAA